MISDKLNLEPYSSSPTPSVTLSADVRVAGLLFLKRLAGV
jgi:hypothetical protein